MMKKEIGKWFLDIAKYVVTAVVLKELFGGFEEKSIVVSIATITALIAFLTGIIILKSADRKEGIQQENYIKNEEQTENSQIIVNAGQPAAKPSTAHKKKGKKK